MRYDRIVLAYHGCDAAVAERLLAGEPFRNSRNDYDWLGSGIYFWEYGPDRALQFARDQQRRGRVAEPTVVGALVQLGNCFDLMDTWATTELAHAFAWSISMGPNTVLPVNQGSTPDQKLRRLDCFILNTYFSWVETSGRSFDTVRCAFREGEAVYPGSGILLE